MGGMLHGAEDVLSALRDGSLTATAPIIDLLLECVAISDGWIEAIAETGTLPEDAASVGQRLRTAMAPHLGGDAAPPAAPPTDTGWVAQLLAQHADGVGAANAAGGRIVALRYAPSRDCFFLGDDPMALIRAVPGLVALEIDMAEATAEALFDPFACTLVFRALSTAPLDEVRSLFRFVPDQTEILSVEAVAAEARPERDGSAEGGSRTLRVDGARIDQLVDIVGELVVAKNGLAHLAREAEAIDPGLARNLLAGQARIDRLVAEIHRGVMAMRLVPLSGTFRRFARPVREIAGRLGKAVTLGSAGGEVEADKTIADSLFEPILHVLRNAIDHGIEDGAARLAAGKPPVGNIALEARRSGDEIVITVTDDGAGVDLLRIAA
jgi:two-component system chemotaxis sensor kinase CheA